MNFFPRIKKKHNRNGTNEETDRHTHTQKQTAREIDRNKSRRRAAKKILSVEFEPVCIADDIKHGIK